MEKEKSNKGLVGVLIIIIVLLLLGLGYVLFGKDLLNKNTLTNANETNNNIAEKYNTYLSNLKKQIKNKYNSTDNYYQNEISKENVLFDTYYNFVINNKLELLFSSSSFKLNNYKVSDNVLNMFFVEEGNGGYQYLYFIKTDGSLNKFCVDCLTSNNNTPKIEKENAKYIVNVIQGAFENENESGYMEPLFIDIDGNITTR